MKGQFCIISCILIKHKRGESTVARWQNMNGKSGNRAEQIGVGQSLVEYSVLRSQAQSDGIRRLICIVC